MPDELHPLDDPAKRPRVVRLLLILSPLAFFLSYALAWMQGAEPRFAALIGGVAAAMALAAAVAIHLLGSKSWIALVAVKVALLLVVRR
jgi:hypothetical protein